MCGVGATRGHKGNATVRSLKSQATDLSTEEKDEISRRIQKY